MTYPFTDVIYRVYSDNEHFLEVGEWPEVPGLVELRSTTAEQYEFFGKINVAMQPEFARKLADALLKCADALEATHE